MISLNPKTTTVRHGGNLEEALKHHNLSKEQWLDLSTGISPWAYPFKALPENVWRELPPSNNALLASAATYFNVSQNSITAASGSQIAIRLLPQLFHPSNVAIPSLGYQEHAASWQMANHQTVRYHSASNLMELINKKAVEHVVVINPNNPSGEKLNLNVLREIIAKVRGVCIIDEAFIDLYDEGGNTTPLCSATKILNLDGYRNLIVLRSVGKFFGLAGIRLGFAIGLHPSLTLLNSLLSPWSISHASQVIGIQALQDEQWQQQQRVTITQQQKAFQKILGTLFDNTLEQYSVTEAGLFNTVFAAKTELKVLHSQLAAQGVWTRLGNENDQPSWLRFGLPKNTAQFEKKVFNLLHQT